MRAYLELIEKVLKTGQRREDRTGTGCLSIFGYQLRFALKDGFPLLTTKKLHIPSIIHELLWFIQGKDDTTYLQENKVTIWNKWIDKKNRLGPVYGVQWRNWPATEADKTIDQLQQVIDTIKKDPTSRRLIVSAWNVSQLAEMRLPPCHLLFQLYVHDGYLSCQLYQRSADIFLGLPFNIASYSLLTHMIAHLCGLIPGEFIHTLGDAHLYLNHLDQAKIQLKRAPQPLPQLRIATPRKTIDAFTFEDFLIEGYDPAPHIKADVSV